MGSIVSSKSLHEEGTLYINNIGEIIHSTAQARLLLALPDNTTTISILNFIFLDLDTLLPVHFDLTKKDRANYIIQISAVNKPKYISVTFVQENVDHFILSLYDNTILIRKLLELKSQEHYQRLLLSSIDDIIFEVNKDGIFLNCWTNKLDLLIHPPSTFIGRPLTNVVPHEISYQVLSLIRACIIDKKQKTYEYSIPHVLDDLKWYSLIVKNIPDPHEIVALVITDITKQKEYQDKLIFSEQRFHQAFQFSGIGTTLTSLEG